MEMSSASLIFWLELLPSHRIRITNQLIGICTVSCLLKRSTSNRVKITQILWSFFEQCVTRLDESWDKHSFRIQTCLQFRQGLLSHQPFDQAALTFKSL